eukprot:857483-Pelagomonas_calceolata.AAC.2
MGKIKEEEEEENEKVCVGVNALRACLQSCVLPLPPIRGFLCLGISFSGGFGGILARAWVTLCRTVFEATSLFRCLEAPWGSSD